MASPQGPDDWDKPGQDDDETDSEIAAICALDCDLVIVAVVDGRSELASVVGVPVRAGFDEIGGEVDAVFVTDMKDTYAAIEAATTRFGATQFAASRMGRMIAADTATSSAHTTSSAPRS